jgi:hypothetical protein
VDSKSGLRIEERRHLLIFLDLTYAPETFGNVLLEAMMFELPTVAHALATGIRGRHRPKANTVFWLRTKGRCQRCLND